MILSEIVLPGHVSTKVKTASGISGFSPSMVAGARAGAGFSEVVFWVCEPRALSRKSQMVYIISGSSRGRGRTRAD